LHRAVVFVALLAADCPRQSADIDTEALICADIVTAMNTRQNLLLPLAPLFTALLSGMLVGCSGYSSCENFKGGTYQRTIELSPADYEQWQMGIPPGSSTGGLATSTTAGTTAGTTGETGADPTTGAATMLTEQEICMMVCAMQSAGGEVESCTIGALNANGKVPVDCVLPAFCEGRRHACVRSHGEHAGQDARATWLARAAHDEAASVFAFLALADELAALGAPGELLARIQVAADDERRHTAIASELALQHGACVPAPIIAPTPPRDLLALAVENIVEGCVRETWAALSAAHQARHAHTQELRDLYSDIADDEVRHAELAWSIHAWLSGQLRDAEQAMVAAARDAAVRQLRTSLAARLVEPELLALGIPGRDTSLHLLAGLDAALWSHAA
jgi:hypothetical protein